MDQLFASMHNTRGSPTNEKTTSITSSGPHISLAKMGCFEIYDAASSTDGRGLHQELLVPDRCHIQHAVRSSLSPYEPTDSEEKDMKIGQWR